MPVNRMRLAEVVNGRAAMFGCSAIGISSLAIKTNLLQIAFTQDIHSFWQVIGIYAT
ncbi:chlorophyll a/b-binding protein [Prochlorococcus sp. MIT 1307]|uniref:chlorophyll a/b-binding protein n=1 Tax=Prochlorococcus sp. MIT 1307 TaxID=3096219 RepID=UPI002A758388|nr:chlorophyll a/b-binding protein [Prochlorococcus sp. MIT 1307]